MSRTSTGELKNTRHKAIWAGACDNKYLFGTLVMSRSANEPSQLQRAAIPRAGIEHITLKYSPGDNKITLECQYSDDRVPPKEVSEEKDTPSDNQDGDN